MNDLFETIETALIRACAPNEMKLTQADLGAALQALSGLKEIRDQSARAAYQRCANIAILNPSLRGRDLAEKILGEARRHFEEPTV